MDCRNLQCLVGKYLNGFKVVKVEPDPFIKGQINLFTDVSEDIGFGDKMVIKFYVNDVLNGASIYREKVNKSEYVLKELEKWLNEEAPYYFEGNYPMIKSVDIRDKLQEIKRRVNGG